MPTISQLPSVSDVTAADVLPLSQDGVAYSVSVGDLLAGTQTAILGEQGTLLGRRSVGVGSPEQVSVGRGLEMKSGVLAANGADHASFSSKPSVDVDDHFVVTGSSGSALIPVSALRQVFSPGENISISPEGQISASGSISSDGAIEGLTVASAAEAGGLIPINQSGSTWSISVENLVNGLTIGGAVAAAEVADTDTFWVAQGSEALVRQNFSAVWSWLVSKLLAYRAPVLELVLDTTLDGDQHNRRVIVCSRGFKLSAPVGGLPNGFQCDIINVSSSDLIFGSEIITSSGATVLSSGRAARVYAINYSGGAFTYAWVQSSSSPSSTSVTLPQITDLSASALSVNSVILAWTAPITLDSDVSYRIQYRMSGTTAWSVYVSDVSSSPCTVAALNSGVLYDFVVTCQSASVTGFPSNIASASTVGAPSTVSPPTNITATNISASGLTLNWNAPVTDPAQTYNVHYRLSGSSTWNVAVSGVAALAYNVSGLSAGSSYDFAVVVVTASGASATSSTLTTATLAAAGLVTSIIWNVVPSTQFVHGSGSVGVNAHVTPSSAPIRFGLSSSTTTSPTSWTAGSYVNTDLWGAYVPTPTTAGTWYLWAAGIDGSSPTVSPTAVTVV